MCKQEQFFKVAVIIMIHIPSLEQLFYQNIKPPIHSNIHWLCVKMTLQNHINNKVLIVLNQYPAFDTFTNNFIK